MKKIFMVLTVIAVCVGIYFYTGPEEQQYLEESEILAYINLGLEQTPDMEENDVQAYTPTDVMKKRAVTKKKKKRYFAVRHYKPRVSTLGFSIIPPPGLNWYEKLEDNSLYYVKINKLHNQYCILTEAREVHLDKKMGDPIEIQSYVKKEKEKDLVSSKFKQPNLTAQVEKSPLEKCVRYRQSYQDHGFKGLGGRRYVNVDIQGLFCLHPDNDEVGIDINFVEKSLSNTQVKSYRNEGEQFLASLNFHKVSGK